MQSRFLCRAGLYVEQVFMWSRSLCRAGLYVELPLILCDLNEK